ncbi:MAG: HAD family hydrolase, partial [Limisphaerales bacterium]
LNRLMEENRSTASTTLMIGDSVTDILAGRNAGAWTCGVTYGIGAATLDEVQPDVRIDDLRELPKLLNGKS